MVKQVDQSKLKEITGVISTVISSTVADSKSIYDSSSLTYQINNGSTNCNNIKVSSSSTTYTASSSVLANSATYQSVVANIVSQLTSDQSQKANGGIFDKQDNELAASIINLIHTKLDSTTMASIGNVANINSASVQVCMDSTGGTNFYFSSEQDIFTYYNTVYSESSTVQSVSADIANTIDASQSQKSTGLIAMIIRMIVIIVIAVVLIVVVGGVAYLATI